MDLRISNSACRAVVGTWGLLHLSPASTFSSYFNHLGRGVKRSNACVNSGGVRWNEGRRMRDKLKGHICVCVDVKLAVLYYVIRDRWKCEWSSVLFL